VALQSDYTTFFVIKTTIYINIMILWTDVATTTLALSLSVTWHQTCIFVGMYINLSVWTGYCAGKNNRARNVGGLTN
jgi:hypothetical protein